MRLPALIDTFSDVIPIDSMTVAANGDVTLNASAPLDMAIGAQQGVSVVDAWTPNAITALHKITSGEAAGAIQAGDVRVTVTYPHNLSTTPDATLYDAWDAFANLTGIGVTALQGNNVQLVAVETDLSIVVRPINGVDVTLPGSVPGGAALLERLERDIIGWHTATVTGASQLTFQTPASVTRSYTVANPKVVRNIRVWGAVDFDHALSHFTRPDESASPVLDQGYLFVLPHDRARLSRDRSARSDAPTEITPTADVRQMLMDGFEIIVVLPAERYGGAVACVDRCQGPIFTAMLKTFNGLRIPRAEISVAGSDYVAFLADHGAIRLMGANYVHSYRFEVPAQLRNDDCIAPVDVPDIAAFDQAIQNGDPGPTDSIGPIGSVPFGGIYFAPDPAYGIWTKDHPQPLTTIIPLN